MERERLHAPLQVVRVALGTMGDVVMDTSGSVAFVGHVPSTNDPTPSPYSVEMSGTTPGPVAGGVPPTNPWHDRADVAMSLDALVAFMAVQPPRSGPPNFWDRCVEMFKIKDERMDETMTERNQQPKQHPTPFEHFRATKGRSKSIDWPATAQAIYHAYRNLFSHFDAYEFAERTAAKRIIELEGRNAAINVEVVRLREELEKTHADYAKSCDEIRAEYQRQLEDVEKQLDRAGVEPERALQDFEVVAEDLRAEKRTTKRLRERLVTLVACIATLGQAE